MFLSTVQILALQQISGIGTQSILKLFSLPLESSSALSISDLLSILSENKIKMKDPLGRGKIEVTTEALNEAIKKANNILSLSKQCGISAISYFDNNFPEILRNTKDESEKKFKPPLLLFYKGNISLLNDPCVAIIGTRNPSHSAINAGLYISKEFAKRDFCIVSGLAIGCDTCGHQGAIDVGGKTIAFLAKVW